jgi:hypothetical protein
MMTQEEVAAATARRYGPDGRIPLAQVSRIEKGQFDRVSLDDAVHLGLLYDLNPNEVATMYGLYNEQSGVKDPLQVQEIRNLALTLPEEDRRVLLQDLELAILRQRMKRRERGDEE